MDPSGWLWEVRMLRGAHWRQVSLWQLLTAARVLGAAGSSLGASYAEIGLKPGWMCL